ncbi:hypothetical protein P9281_01575 [Caballeronia sp. LP003]|uniref:hypothetical protein n=1 Tax=Caballeronia sp. LP003 TaxID=3038551 RepID=UPI00286373D8|nr:hypothetical protein [Caballeronia sp. LP003]MDR5785252.1 hypothetical protein [Caballeronia sp. LP003]
MPTISIRLNDAQKIELEERSARHDGNVSEYIKFALFGKGHENGQEVLLRLDELADAMLRSSSARDEPGAAHPDSAATMLMEVLMLLRMALPPEKIRSARAELDRLAIPSWEPTREGYRG